MLAAPLETGNATLNTAPRPSTRTPSTFANTFTTIDTGNAIAPAARANTFDPVTIGTLVLDLGAIL